MGWIKASGHLRAAAGAVLSSFAGKIGADSQSRRRPAKSSRDNRFADDDSIALCMPEVRAYAAPEPQPRWNMP